MFLRKMANPIWALFLLCSLAAAANERADCTSMKGIDEQFGVDFDKLNFKELPGSLDDTKNRVDNDIVEVDVDDDLKVGSFPLSKYLEQYMVYKDKKIGLQLNFKTKLAFDKFISSNSISARRIARSLTFSKIPIILKVVEESVSSVKTNMDKLSCYTLNLIVSDQSVSDIKGITSNQQIIYNFESGKVLLENEASFVLTKSYGYLNFVKDDAKLNMKEVDNLIKKIPPKRYTIVKHEDVEDALAQCLITEGLNDFLKDKAMKDLKWGSAIDMKPATADIFKATVSSDLKVGTLSLADFLSALNVPAKKGLALLFDDTLTEIKLNEALKIIGESKFKTSKIPIWIHLPVMNEAAKVTTWDTKLKSVIAPCLTPFYGWKESANKLTDDAFEKMEQSFKDGVYRVPANRVSNWAHVNKLSVTNKNTVVVADTDTPKGINIKDYKEWTNRKEVSEDSEKLQNWVNMCVKHKQISDDARKQQEFVDVKSEDDMEKVTANQIMKVALEEIKGADGKVTGVNVEGWTNFDDFLTSLKAKANAKVQLTVPSEEAFTFLESSKFEQLDKEITFILDASVVKSTSDREVVPQFTSGDYEGLLTCFGLSLGWTSDSTKYDYQNIKGFAENHGDVTIVVPDTKYVEFKGTLGGAKPVLTIHSVEESPSTLGEMRNVYNTEKYFWNVPVNYLSVVRGDCLSLKEQNQIFEVEPMELQWTMANTENDVKDLMTKRGMININVAVDGTSLKFGAMTEAVFTELLKPATEEKPKQKEVDDVKYGFKFIISTTDALKKLATWAKTNNLESVKVPIVIHADVVGDANSADKLVEIDMENPEEEALLKCRTLSIGYSGEIKHDATEDATEEEELDKLKTYRKTLTDLEKVIYSVSIDNLAKFVTTPDIDSKDRKLVLKSKNNKVLETALRKTLNTQNVLDDKMFLDLEEKDRLDILNVPTINSYFGIEKNLTTLKWTQSVNTEAKLTAAIKDNNRMIDLTVNLVGADLVITDIPAPSPEKADESFKLSQALNLIEAGIIEGKQIGVQLILSTTDVAKKLKDDTGIVDQLKYLAAPILIHGDTLIGEGSTETEKVDLTELLPVLTNRELSLGWKWPPETKKQISTVDINKMEATLVEYDSVTAPKCIAFPLTMFKSSYTDLKTILTSGKKATLQATWTKNSVTDNDEASLIAYRDSFGKKDVAETLYLDVPQSVIKEIEAASAVGLGPASLVVLVAVAIANIVWH